MNQGTDKQTDRHTDRQIDRHTDRQTHRQTDKQKGQTDAMTDRLLWTTYSAERNCVRKRSYTYCGIRRRSNKSIDR